MRIALDAMGTDQRPYPDVEGAILAAREYGDTIILIGDEKRIQKALQQHNTNGLKLEILHTNEEIAMHDKPSVVMKSKPQSPVHLGMNMVKDGDADGFVSMGNTGATHAIATLSTLRRIPGVKRPALTAIYPIHGKETIFVDVGANADSRVEWIEQFAIMGSIYAERALGRSNPIVGTLSNGEEEGKGNLLVNETQQRLKKTNLNYIGHIEPKEMLSGKADVIVMDGFVGNIFLKTFEAAIVYFSDLIRKEMKADALSMLGGLLAKPAFGRVRGQIDPRGVGGAPLLGVNGVVIVGHGGSDAFEVKNSIKQARKAIQGGAVEAIQEGLEQLKTNS